MKLKQLLSILCFLPLLWSCNNEDDIYEIFVSGTWNVGNFYTGGNWDKTNDGARPKYTKEEDIKMLNALTINFLDDGHFKVVYPMEHLVPIGKLMPTTAAFPSQT